MKLLVTGGAGFIGSHFVRQWAEQYPRDEITVLDKLTYAGHVENLSDVKGVQIVEGDILDEELVSWLVREVDGVMHFAAETHVDRSLAGPSAEQLFQETNFIGTQVVLKASEGKRFHHVSTDEVFGDLPYDSPARFTEASLYNPQNPYSLTKAAADMAVYEYMIEGRVFGTISYSGNNYGPRQTPEKMIPRSIALLLGGEKIKLYTDEAGVPGRNVRDWTYVDDHVRALKTIFLDAQPSRVYCIGGGNQISNRELVDMLLSEVSEATGAPYRFDTHVELIADRPGHDRRYDVDTALIQKELNWQPRIHFRDGLRSTVAWYLSKEGRGWLETVKDTTRDIPPFRFEGPMGKERR